MKIKLALLDQDQFYLNRIVTAFSTKYPDKFEIYSFTDKEIALSTLASTRIDVFIASDVFDIEMERLPKRCGFAYFVETADLESVKGQEVICKFQKADLIYKQILSIYSEHAGTTASLKSFDENCKTICFVSPSGGVGASTMAAACALHYASLGKRVLYLNLEKYGSADTFFNGEGQLSMSDVIFTLKSKKANLSLKLESCVKKDVRGVDFYSQSQVALDMLELKKEDMITLLSEFKISGNYDFVIVDMDFSLTKDYLDIYREMAVQVWVGDGSEVSNAKLRRAYEALTILEQNRDDSLLYNLVLLYNKFSNKSSKAIEGIEIKNIGGAPKYEHATVGQILSQMGAMTVFEAIM